jgi:hypothetical protein
MATILRGDYDGTVTWVTRFRWHAGQAENFLGVRIEPLHRFYAATEIVRVSDSRRFFPDQPAEQAAIVAGPVGGVVGLMPTESITFEIEFSDGKKVGLREDRPTWNASFKAFEVFVEKAGLRRQGYFPQRRAARGKLSET